MFPPLPSIPFTEYICGDKFRQQFECHSSFPKIAWSKTDFVLDLISSRPEIIVTHNSDLGITHSLVLAFPRLRKWFGQNVLCEDSQVIPIPIGLENDYIADSAIRKQTICHLSSSACAAQPPSKLLYINFSFSTCEPERRLAWKSLTSKPWSTARTHGSISHESYCQDILNHWFVASPQGNGLDCVRTWETLYLRRFPVLRRQYKQEALYSDLPVVFVDNWQQVTEDFLRETIERFMSSSFDPRKLTFSYWKDMINQSIC